MFNRSPHRPPPTATRQMWLLELDGQRSELRVWHSHHEPALVISIEGHDIKGIPLADVRALKPRLLMRLR